MELVLEFQPNIWKFLKRNHQKININERFTGIMKAKGHVSPFARGTKPDQQGKNWYFSIKIGLKSVILDEIRVEAAEGPTRSRRTSVMSDSDYQANDAVESAFKRALKKAAPNMEMVEEEQSESSFAGSHRSEVRNHNFILNFHKLFFSNRNNHQCNRPMQHQPFLQCQVFLEFQKLQKPLPIYQVKINRSSKSDQLRGWVWYSILGTTMSSIPSIVSGKSAVTDITTASERSTNTTSTTSGASTIQECFCLRKIYFFPRSRFMTWWVLCGSSRQFYIILRRVWL